MKALPGLSLVLFLSYAMHAFADGGISGNPAPKWDVPEWRQLPEGKESLDIDDFKDKVLYLFCFQSWCPGCHSRGFPTLQALIKKYEGDEQVAFVAVQTVFEGFGVNSSDRAWETARKYKLQIPIGHSGSADKRSVLMQRYRTRGTPWTIIVDPEGRVVFDDFHIEAGTASKLIEKHRGKKPAPNSKAPVAG
jgi:thiol-disulfide isomerase/thioredoxin